MKIHRVELCNFRCFGAAPETINFNPTATALVGNNGSGKTAIFLALQRMFGITNSQRTIRKSDFHLAPDAAELVNGAELHIDCVLSFPELEVEEVEDGQDNPFNVIPEVFQHMCASDEDAPLYVRMRLQARWLEDGTPEGTVEQDLKWVTTLDEEFVWDDCKRVQAAERNFIQFVYVPANRNASDQVTALLKGRLWRAARWSRDLTDAATVGAERVQEQFDGEAPATFVLERLQKRWEEVHQGDTDTQPEFRLIETRLDELVRSAEFAFVPDAAGQPRRLEDLSDGQRSLFHIALTAATLEMEHDALALPAQNEAFDQQKLRRTYLTILGIEEPENCLSPFFLSRIMIQCRNIGEMPNAQSLVSSHSASILARLEPEEVRYLRHVNETKCSTVRELTLPPEETDARRYVRLAVKSYPELYFARAVVLAEGDSERIVLPRLAEAMGFPLDQAFVPIVPLGGRFVSHFWRLLNDLEIPAVTLLDLDAGRKHGGANAIRYVIEELGQLGNDLSANRSIVNGEIDLEEKDEIDDQELVDQDQAHPWLKALRRERVFFSSPIDLDFAMLYVFGETYQKVRPGGRGPKLDEASVAAKKLTTLKTDGNPELFDDRYDDAFAWYPYLFLGQSKPEAHLAALADLSDEELEADAPEELKRLIRKVRALVLE